MPSVGFVCRHPLRTQAGSSPSHSSHLALLHPRLEHDRLVALPHRQHKGDRQTIALTAQMKLGAKPTFAISQCFCLCIAVSSASGVLMRSNHTAIDKVELSAKLTSGICLLLQPLENLLPQSSFAPSVEAS